MIELKDIERSIIKTYRKELWSRFTKGIMEYSLVNEGDKIAVAISGGKDSILMALLFKELKRHGKFNFELEFLVMDPGYSKETCEKLFSLLKYLEIPYKVFKSNIFEVANILNAQAPCYMCAKMRRGALYNFTKELNCNKLALGHHFNDVIETTMLNILYNGSFKTMLPKLKSKNFENIELIRPMYYIREEDIIRFKNHSKIDPIDEACSVEKEKKSTKRMEIKKLIQDLKKINPNVDKNIFMSAKNVYIGQILGINDDGKSKSYLEF